MTFYNEIEKKRMVIENQDVIPDDTQKQREYLDASLTFLEQSEDDFNRQLLGIAATVVAIWRKRNHVEDSEGN